MVLVLASKLHLVLHWRLDSMVALNLNYGSKLKVQGVLEEQLYRTN